MSSYNTYMFIHGGKKSEMLHYMAKLCEENISIKGKVLCGFFEFKNELLAMNVLADYDIHDGSLICAEKLAERVIDKITCIHRSNDGQVDMKAWDGGKLIYDFCLEEKKQWIEQGYENWFIRFDDPHFTDTGLDWRKNWKEIAEIFEKIYGEDEADYFDIAIRKMFPKAIEELDHDAWKWRAAYHSMEWYKVFSDMKVVNGFPRVEGYFSQDPELVSWRHCEWYP